MLSSSPRRFVDRLLYVGELKLSPSPSPSPPLPSPGRSARLKSAPILPARCPFVSLCASSSPQCFAGVPPQDALLACFLASSPSLRLLVCLLLFPMPCRSSVTRCRLWLLQSAPSSQAHCLSLSLGVPPPLLHALQDFRHNALSLLAFLPLTAPPSSCVPPHPSHADRKSVV